MNLEMFIANARDLHPDATHVRLNVREHLSDPRPDYDIVSVITGREVLSLEDADVDADAARQVAVDFRDVIQEALSADLYMGDWNGGLLAIRTETVTVDVPAAWFGILTFGEFGEMENGLEDVLGRPVLDAENHRGGLDDINCYYDDVRMVGISDGVLNVQVALCSGQGNYWLGVDSYVDGHIVGEEIDLSESFCDVEFPGVNVRFNVMWDSPKRRATAIETVKSLAGVSKRAAATMVDNLMFDVDGDLHSLVSEAVAGVTVEGTSIHAAADIAVYGDRRFAADQTWDERDTVAISSTTSGETLLWLREGHMDRLTIAATGESFDTNLPTDGGPNPLLAARRVRAALGHAMWEDVRKVVRAGAKVTADEDNKLQFEGMPSFAQLDSCGYDLLDVIHYRFGPDVWVSGTFEFGPDDKFPVLTVNELNVKCVGEPAANELVELMGQHRPDDVSQDGRRVTVRWNFI